MLMVEYLNSQFSLAQNLDFFLRILAACFCGATIGVERSKRLKKAGVRTHIIVCCGAALMMIVSKYGFADLTAEGVNFNGIRGADSARIAAQVVSGISFLGAGVIFKHGSAVRGLTTAAGLWATAGIGLAVGAGMYPVGIFTTILVALIQVLMHKFAVGLDTLVSSRLAFAIRTEKELPELMERYIRDYKAQIMDTKITYYDDGFVAYDFMLRMPQDITATELSRVLRNYGEVRSVSVILES